MTAKFIGRDDGEIRTVTVVGEVDVANAGELETALTGAGARIVVELDRAEYLDSAGLRVLFTHARTRRLELVLRRGGGVEQVVTLSGLTEVAAIRYD
ncbi:STAS domain-containing protein [Allokutzneria sp. A3M-2-11 16]|uniref:STAS domain-containing protein n=1 Tax=Allokutzneria sp. A3M-2-11 16 TaxID=2962043 RepID=UPI0020B78AE7|nr:STAS domain-containing protein [Allokutzneria sp. A3M-2-11 16]MCP3803879.1 STAS domain-containing protein [Allokutzneria sp. A3M-2-11 16]